MKRRRLISLLCVAIFFSSCASKINWKVSLDKNDKNPYGSWLAYRALPLLFPTAEVTDLSKGYRYGSINGPMMNAGKQPNALILLGLDFYTSAREWDKLLAFTRQGNELFIAARRLDPKIQKYLGYEIEDGGLEEVGLTHAHNGADNKNVLSTSAGRQRFGYQGKYLRAYLTAYQADTQNISLYEAEIDRRPSKTDTLGWMSGKPNFLRFHIGKGHLYLHTAPLAFSNYFLLQQNNRIYFEQLFQKLPKNLAHIYWNNYFKRHEDQSDLRVLLNYPATKWAFIIVLFTSLVYLLFESKRKQAIIPVTEPLGNSSVSFVETIGRLYYNKGNHNNIAEKMIQHFLEWVRAHYYLPTSRLDENFYQLLIRKSGMPQEQVRQLENLIFRIQTEQAMLSDNDLFTLHQIIQQFYQTKKADGTN